MSDMWLRELRDAWELTQQSLADHAGVSRSLIARIERGDKEPSTRTIQGLGVVFDMAPGKILDMVIKHRDKNGD